MDEVKQAYQNLVSEQEKAEQDFRKEQAEFNNQIKSVRESLLKRFQKSKVGEELPPELQEINMLLQSNPILIPYVKKYIEKQLIKLNQVIQSTLNEND